MPILRSWALALTCGVAIIAFSQIARAADDLGAQVGTVSDTGGFRLLITNFDRNDPPDYSPGDVPRPSKFNKNIFPISTEPKMPVLDVACEVQGFTPSAKMPNFWRLQTLHVLGRFRNVGKYHYGSRVANLDGEWTGTSTAGMFRLFGEDQGIVIYDNLDDRVCGGHALLTVACRVAPNGPWLQDYVHLRITGNNPTKAKIRKEVAAVLYQQQNELTREGDSQIS